MGDAKSASEIVKTAHLARNKRQRRAVEGGEFTPTDQDLQMYLLWAQGTPTTRIARDFTTPDRTTRKRLTLVSNWLRAEIIDQLADVRSHQYFLLMTHYRQLEKLRADLAQAGASESRAIVTVMKEQRETLAQVAVLIGLNVGKSGGDASDQDDGVRWAGLPQTMAIQRQIALLTERLVVTGQPAENKGASAAS